MICHIIMEFIFCRQISLIRTAGELMLVIGCARRWCNQFSKICRHDMVGQFFGKQKLVGLCPHLLMFAKLSISPCHCSLF